MKICYGSDFVRTHDNNIHAAVTLGYYDGVHLGHRMLIEALKVYAALGGLVPCLYTFINQPAAVLRPETAGEGARLLTDNRRKAELIAGCGVEELYFDWFDRTMSELTPEAFVREILVGRFGARVAVVGQNYTFGRGGSGDANTLAALGRSYGFETIVLPSVRCELDGKRQIVSSSLLRRLAAEGRFEVYREIAGSCYSLSGTVRHGRGVGRTLGFPTANMLPPAGAVLPARGVYATTVKLPSRPGQYLKAITNVGRNPTFPDASGSVNIETHILGIDEDLYGTPAEVYFIKKLRAETVFESPAALARQLRTDAQTRAETAEFPKGDTV